VLTKKSGVYTRKIGLDKETNKELLLKHIRSNAKIGSKFNELHQVLPFLSRDQLKQILKKLKAPQGLIYPTGGTKASLWLPSS
jgi:ATP-dependent DNA helicase RecG